MRYIDRLRSLRMTPLTIIAIAVCAIMLSGGAYATAATLITGKNVLDHSLTGRDIKNGSLTAKAFKKGTIRAGAKGANGATGEATAT